MDASAGTGLPLLAISIVTLLWAGNFTAGKLATDEIHPFLIAGIRVVIAGVVFPLFLPRGTLRELASGAIWRKLLPLALTGIFVNQFAFAAGIKITSPSHSALVHALIPIFVVIIAWIFLREKAGPWTLGGMALAIAGGVWLALGQSSAERDATWVGDLLTLLGAVAFSAYAVIGRRVTPEVGSYKAVALGFLMAIPLSLPLLGWGVVQQDWHAVTWKGLAGLGYMIVAGTFICYSLHMWSVSRLGALRVSVFTNFQPILGTLIGLGFGVDRVTLRFVVAGAVILAGVAIVQLAKR